MFEREPPESYPEIGTVKRIYEGIYCGIDPTEPSEIGHHETVDLVGR